MTKIIVHKGVQFTEIPFPEFQGRYLVSRDGRVMSTQRKGVEGVWFLKPRVKKSGYVEVSLTIPGKRVPRTPRLHLLVAVTFLGDRRSEGMEIDHINGIKADNSVANLNWVTKSEQHIRAHRLGLKPGVGQFKQRSVAKIDPTTEEIVKIYYSINQAHREDGHKSGAITLCCQGKQGLHHGFRWKYMEK